MTRARKGRSAPRSMRSRTGIRQAIGETSVKKKFGVVFRMKGDKNYNPLFLNEYPYSKRQDAMKVICKSQKSNPHLEYKIVEKK